MVAGTQELYMTPKELELEASKVDINRLRTSRRARAWLTAGTMSLLFAIGPFIMMLQATNTKVWTFAILVVCQLVVSLTLINVSLFIHRLENIERICREESARLAQLYPPSPSQTRDRSA